MSVMLALETSRKEAKGCRRDGCGALDTEDVSTRHLPIDTRVR